MTNAYERVGIFVFHFLIPLSCKKKIVLNYIYLYMTKHTRKKHHTKQRRWVKHATRHERKYRRHQTRRGGRFFTENKILSSDRYAQRDYFKKFVACQNKTRVRRFFTLGQCWDIPGSRYKLTPDNHLALKDHIIRNLLTVLVIIITNKPVSTWKQDEINFYNQVKSQIIHGTILKEVANSLGVVTKEGGQSVILKKDSTNPVYQSGTYSSSYHYLTNQEKRWYHYLVEDVIAWYEGENHFTKRSDDYYAFLTVPNSDSCDKNNPSCYLGAIFTYFNIHHSYWPEKEHHHMTKNPIHLVSASDESSADKETSLSNVAGQRLKDGVPTTLPEGVDAYDPQTQSADYLNRLTGSPQTFMEAHQNSVDKEKKRLQNLVQQYINKGPVSHPKEIDYIIGNKLTRYLLTMHPQLSYEFREYQTNLTPEKVSFKEPVIRKDFKTIRQIEILLNGLKDLNKYLRTFPPLNAKEFPDGVYVYRGKPYQNEVEILKVGQTFKLSQMTSTSFDINMAIFFGNWSDPSITKYKDAEGTVVTKQTKFLWRIRIPTNVSFPYIQTEGEQEVLLPLGTKLKYLGSHVQLVPPPALSILWCEFEVVGMERTDILLSRLIKQVKDDFESEETKKLLLNEETIQMKDPIDVSAHEYPIQPQDYFGGKT